LVTVCLSCPASIWGQEEDTRLRVVKIQGSASAYHDESDETSRLKAGDKIDDGDKITTGAKSRIVLRLPGRAYVVLGPNTKINVSRLRIGEKGLQVRLNLLTGDLWCQLDKPPDYAFEVSMQNLICRCHGVLLEAVRQKDDARIIAFEGSVVATSGAQVKIAKTGEILQYIHEKFRYKHRLKKSDEIRRDQWKKDLGEISLSLSSKTH
jgi:ferric-dicitrate binding protein FerR (iron transport regulator)